MADITDKKGKKLEWYKYVVKRYLRDILQDLANSKNQMGRSYYETRYACQLDAFAKALNVRLNCWRSTSYETQIFFESDLDIILKIED